jgi:hypothetical protein
MVTRRKRKTSFPTGERVRLKLNPQSASLEVSVMIGVRNSLDARGVTKVSHGGPVASIVRGLLGFAAGALLGIVGITAAFMLLFLPPIGWVVAPIVVLASIALPALLAVCGSKIVVGNCPQCGSHVWGMPSGGKITCNTCNHAFVVASP